MKSQFPALSTLSMPWAIGGNKSPKTSIRHRYNLYALLQQLLAWVFIGGVAALLIGSGSLSASQGTSSATQRIPYPYASLFTPKTLLVPRSTAVKPPAVKPAKSVAAALPCIKEQSGVAETLFATCPTLSLNFATQPTGLPSAKDFNIYSGEPVANQEAQLYTNSQQNVKVENGSLNLTALNQPEQGFKYTSARVDTDGKEDFLYGSLVVRATMPDGIGTWPAIWMLSADNKYESLSPPSDPDRYLNDGEIDIAESVGAQPNVVYGIAHSLAYPANGPNRNYYSTVAVPGNDTIAHDYGLDWTPTNLTFTVDGAPYFSISKQPGANYQSWPYDQPFYLILNLAMGGTWGGTDRAQFPVDGVDPSALPSTMKVQSINYYPYIGPGATSKN